MTSSGREDFFSKTLLFYCINDNSLPMHTFLEKKQKAKKKKNVNSEIEHLIHS